MWKKVLKNENWVLVILAVAVILSFSNIFPNQFMGDDFDFIVDWPLVRDFNNIPRFFTSYFSPELQENMYSPLRTLVFSFTHHFFGLNTFGYHLFSIFIHLFGVWAVYYLIRLLTGDAEAAFWGGFIFAVHPVHVDAITPMAEASATMGFVFLLWAFYFYVRMFGGSEAAALTRTPARLTKDVNSRYYFFSLCLTVFAVLINEMAWALPVLVLFYDAFFSPERYCWKRIIKRTLPFIGLLGFYFAIKYMVPGEGWISYNASGGAYSGIPVILLWIMAFVLIAAAGFLYWRKRFLLAFCIGWFMLSLLFISRKEIEIIFYTRRYLYGASFAGFLLIAYLFIEVYRKLLKRKRWVSKAFLGMFCVWIGFCFVRTLTRNKEYRNDIVFYEGVLRRNPMSSSLHNALGIIYIEEGLFEKAIESLEAARALNPKDSEVYFSLASVYSALERYDEGFSALKKVVELDPDHAEAYFNLAGMEVFLGREKDGLENLSSAVSAWKRKGMIIEAGEAFEVFQIFLLERKGLLPDVAPEKFLDGVIQ